MSAGSEWHARRAGGFGASDIPALMLALGGCSEQAPRYLADRAKTISRGKGKGLSRIIAEKAGIVPALSAGSAAARGTARERELLEYWCALISSERSCEASSLMMPASITHADALLRCCWPIVDRRCPRLSATLDAWAVDELGAQVVIELKCSATERLHLPWYWRAQVLAQLAVTGADYGLLVCGEMWSAWHGQDGPVRVWPIERDEGEIDALRELVRRGWAEVEAARESAKADAEIASERMAQEIGFDPAEEVDDDTERQATRGATSADHV